ncbi:MAG: hypothetical protein ACOH5I_08795 [Oligoflexus sp.]
MGTQKNLDGVGLPEGQTGSSFLCNILAEAVAAFPEEFENYKPLKLSAFKKNYGEALVQFEAHRVSSSRRTEIAQFMVQRTQEQLQYKGEGFQGKFREFMTRPTKPIDLEVVQMQAKAGLAPSVSFNGVSYGASSLPTLAQKLLGECKMTRSAAQALSWLKDYTQEHGGKIDLSGKKFVIMGASAELAPTAMLLEAGAHVLWIDIKSPEDLLSRSHKYSGSLSFSREVNNILLQPDRIRDAIVTFAAGDPVHMGMFAYAAGASQEWRLAATMNGIICSLPPSIVASVSLLISPTTVAVIQPEDMHNAASIKKKPPFWQSLLRSAGQLSKSVSYDGAACPVARAIVPLQGVSYQAAQYISKTLASEVFAAHGVSLQGETRSVRVSANVAGITKTRSLQHPVFQAAFLGAKAFGVEIFEVPTTRNLATLLMLHDLLNPESYQQDNVSSVFAKQVHGGIYSRAFALDPMIRIATVMGLCKRPKLLLGLF